MKTFLLWIALCAVALAQTPAQQLGVAIMTGKAERVQALCSANPGLANVSPDGTSTPLSLAILVNPSLDVLQALLSAGADVNRGGAGGITPLGAAISVGKPEVVDLLLKNRADANLNAAQGGRTNLQSALYVAQNRGVPASIRLCQLLLAAGALPNQADNRGTTPLQIAISLSPRLGDEKAAQLVETLLQGGVDPNVMFMAGGQKTKPIRLATALGLNKVQAALRAHGAQ